MTTPAPTELGPAVDRYKRELKTAGTLRTYSAALDPMVAHYGDGYPLADLEPAAVADWFAEQWGQRSDGTIATRMNAIKGAAAWWLDKGWITTDPGRALKRPTKPREALAPEIYSTDEVQAMLDKCYPYSATGIRSRALIMLLYRSGLRIGEALRAKPGDFDFASHSVRIKQTKTGQAQTRGWHPMADADLLRWIDKRRSLGIRGGPLFCGVKGNPVTPDSFRRTLGRLAHRAGIEDKRVYPHAFRNTFAVEMVRAGVALHVTSKMLGHKSLATTERYLRGLTNDEAVQALQIAVLPELAAGLPADRSPFDPEPVSEVELMELRAQVAALSARLDAAGD